MAIESGVGMNRAGNSQNLATLDLVTVNTTQQSADVVASLSELDLAGVEPTAHAAVLTNVWREDAAEPSYDRDRMLANAPALIDGDLIRVPQVLPGEGSN